MLSCSQCLFTSENHPAIQLNAQGVCDICEINAHNIQQIKNQKDPAFSAEMIQKIKASKKGKYDCLIGISGGTDSSYLVYLAKQWGLSPLLMHVDGGWNSEVSVINIERIVENSGYDFVTEVLPWDEMRDIQRAFIEANVLDIDLPFDNAMLMYNYLVAKKYNIKYVINGYSIDTEGIMPSNFTHYKLDRRNLLDIHKRFGKVKLSKLKFIGTFSYWYWNRVEKIEFLHPLDWINYNKSEAKTIIQKEFDWRDYGGKHYENIFTRFYQGHILPVKFGIDKRISHLSMLICSGQLTKEEAKRQLESLPLYPNELLQRDDQLFFMKKLQLTAEQMDLYLKTPPQSHRVFKSDLDYYDFFRPFYRFLKRVFQVNFFKK